jgi:hypothetical protein
MTRNMAQTSERKTVYIGPLLTMPLAFSLPVWIRKPLPYWLLLPDPSV